MQFEGVVSVLKPPGMTSSDVVVDIRRIFGERRVGHTGTLDPAAAGVLPICIGRATRLFDYLVDKEKEYIAEIRFGAETDTEDACGTVIAESSRMVSKAELEKILPDFIGEIEQVPRSLVNGNNNRLKFPRFLQFLQFRDRMRFADVEGSGSGSQQKRHVCTAAEGPSDVPAKRTDICAF